MNIAKEMLANKLAEVIKESINSFELDAEGEAVKALSEISEVINEIAPDEETVFRIAWILKRHSNSFLGKTGTALYKTYQKHGHSPAFLD